MEATQDTGAEVPVVVPEVKDATAAVPQSQEQKRHKLKIYDQEEEYTEEEVLKMAQKSRAADYKFNKAAELDKARASWLETAKKNPWVVFDELGLNADELAEARLMEKLKKIDRVAFVRFACQYMELSEIFAALAEGQNSGKPSDEK